MAKGTTFGWLNATQFLGALNDNVFKLLLVFYLISVQGESAASRAGAMGLVLLAAPFLLFSASAGTLADRFSKRQVIVWAKVAEVVIMLLGLAAFRLRSQAGLYAAMFLMAAQSAAFGPSKYGIVPELVGKEGLSRANGMLQAFTYLAVILGTVLAPWLSEATGRRYGLASLVCVAVAVAGTLTSLPIRRTAPAGGRGVPSWAFLRQIAGTLASIRGDRYLFLAVLAGAYFLMLGAYMQFNLIPYGIHSLGLSQEHGSYLFLFGAVGIGMGSLLAGRLSGRNVELGVVPLGAAGLTLSALALGTVTPNIHVARALVWAMGLGAGLFIVPVEAWVQFRSPPSRRGEILAASGFLSWVGVVLAAGLIYLLGDVLHLDARRGFVIMGLLTLALSLVTVCLLPDFLLRFVGVMLARCFYRVRVVGAENIPVEGPALLVCNHVSWADALLLMATQQRRIRFLAGREVCENRWLGPLMRLMGVIPVSLGDRPKRLLRSLGAARAALDEGYLVCIFAEGALTRTGNLLAFKSGFQYIVRDTQYPIIPVYLGGAWGSVFSYAHGRPLSRWPTIFPYAVTVLFGSPLPATVSPLELRNRVMDLSCGYFDLRKASRRPLFAEFVGVARRNWRRTAVADSCGRRVRAGHLLASGLALGERLRDRTKGQEYVGLLLPPSVAGVVANLAVCSLGRVPVNLNYTASAQGFESAIRQCGIRCVVTSRGFVGKLGRLPVPGDACYVEDLAGEVTAGGRLAAWVKARFAPRWLAWPTPAGAADRVATVLFSSGSTAEPKGILLSHHNIHSNIESLRIVFQPSPRDCVCAALPFFHSFGFTTTLWFPLLSGFPAVYHANPLDGAAIGALVRTHRATLLFATPTFLLAYLRKAGREDFASLRMVVVGAEKLKPDLADAFAERFGIRPLEGYGATELAPVASLNVPDVEAGGVRQVGAKPGTVGHPLPGVSVRVVDPETGEPAPPGASGMLLVRGPNVMLGYLGRPETTAEAIQDGWYRTGDLARVDEDGFITITDRLSRFSKIGGEMVPHSAVEDELHRRLAKSAPVLAVTSVADDRRGERLVVLYTPEAGTPEEMRNATAGSELPNLWKPGADSFFPVAELPVLGSGKLDLRSLREKASAMVRQRA